ncbi:hypothetical protein DFJ74DRAFT_394522 [Hyaloraphidium curvatum]|nr:hypothetical protein DFJ74DRAFT_394522 [Hyaloraphidium curvatum]
MGYPWPRDVVHAVERHSVRCLLANRALSLALKAFVEEQDRLAGGDEPVGCDGACYIRLQELLSASWQRSLDHLSTARTQFVIWLVSAVAFIIVTITVGSCATVGLIFTALGPAGVMLHDLLSIATFNVGVKRTSALYDAASADLCRIAMRHPRSPHLPMLAVHRELLGAYARGAGRFRGRFLGFEVDFGMVRTLLVTVFTVAIGLASILRGSDIFVTIENVCPGGTS